MATDDDEADYEPLDAPAPDGDAAGGQDGPVAPRERPDPERQRRHQQVRRKKRR